MKTRKMTKVAAAALAMAMCVPSTAFAGSATPVPTTAPASNSGSFNTSFDVYSPKLTIQVPVNLNIEVNPLADSSATGVKKFSVASNSLDIWNASVDVDADTAIPVNVTVKATITDKADGVVTEYNTFTESPTSTVKRVHLKLSEAQKAATLKVKDGGAAAFDSEKKLDLSQYTTDDAAVYTTPKKESVITKYGSLLSVDIAGPTTSDATAGKTFSSDADAVKAAVGSFAVTGVANANADWKADDIKVEVTYDVKASAARNITTPAIGTAPTFTSGAGAADITIIIPDVGEAKVFAVGCHNDGEGLYGDYIWENSAYTVTYAENSTSKKIEATIKFPKDDPGLATFLAGDDYKGKAQDFVVGLSDGRMVISTITVN